MFRYKFFVLGKKKNHSHVGQVHYSVYKDDKQKRFSSEGVDNAVYLSANDAIENPIAVASNNGCFYERPDDHTYICTKPVDINENPSASPNNTTVVKSTSKSELLSNDSVATNVNDYAQLDHFNQDVYQKVSGSYLSMNESLYEGAYVTPNM